MLPIWKSDSERNALTYNGFTFNEYVDGSKKDIIEVNRIVTTTIMQAVHEPNDFADGLQTYGAYKRGKRLVLYGIIRASTLGGLHDRIEEFAAAMDPALASRDNPTTFGVLPMTFNVPTDDTDNFASGLIPCQLYVRAEACVEPPMSLVQGLAVPFILPLLASDPRRYLQSTKQLANAGTADNSIATHYSYPLLSIAMSGAGDSDFTIASAEASAELVLDLSGTSDEDAIVVDMERKRITVNGVEDMSIYVSGDYFAMEPSTNVITADNTTNASFTLTWRPAFSS